MAKWVVIKKGIDFCVDGDAVDVELDDHMTAEEVAQVLYEQGVLEKEAVKGRVHMYNPSDLGSSGICLYDENYYPHVSMVPLGRCKVCFPDQEDVEKGTVCAAFWDPTWVDRAANYQANLGPKRSVSSFDAVDAGIATGVFAALFNFWK